jgi:glycerol-3-phosphate acyltransferase PlsY
VYLWLLSGEDILIYAQICIALLLFWRHRNNIRNLLAGVEPRIGESKVS